MDVSQFPNMGVLALEDVQPFRILEPGLALHCDGRDDTAPTWQLRIADAGGVCAQITLSGTRLIR
jgi:hypothetical protein